MSMEIRQSLDPLFRQARAEGLWFFCSYQQLWFSPDELAAEHENGKFLWGPVNWHLRDPAEREQQLRGAVERAGNELYRFRERSSPERDRCADPK
tara:strand:+ start:4012 stop:4296 length:285 start_codon:yes stop_codon:yes gene_type:complete